MLNFIVFIKFHNTSGKRDERLFRLPYCIDQNDFDSIVLRDGIASIAPMIRRSHELTKSNYVDPD